MGGGDPKDIPVIEPSSISMLDPWNVAFVMSLSGVIAGGVADPQTAVNTAKRWAGVAVAAMCEKRKEDLERAKAERDMVDAARGNKRAKTVKGGSDGWQA